jgi:hypothetical protein
MKIVSSLARACAVLFYAWIGFIGPAAAQVQVPAGAVPIGRGPGQAGFSSVPGTTLSVNIETFGASPSASAAVNTAAIQAAINSITSTGAAGRLLVPRSNYNINAPIIVNGPIDIWCAPFLNASGGTFNGAQGGGVMFAFRASYARMTGCYLNRAGTPQAGDDAIAVGDDQGALADAICTNGSGTVTSASLGFTGASIGQRIALTSCAAAGATLFSTITAKASGGSITVSPPAGNTPGAGVAAKYGNVYVENTFRDVWMVNHINGIHLIDAAQQHLDHVYSNSKVGALVENQLSADYGDSFISDSMFLSTDNTNGAALQINSSGGLKISNSKFLFGKYGIYINWNLGGSANPILTNNSIESFTSTGIFINTAVTLTRVNITGGSIAGATGANAITVDNTSAAALTDINIIGVTMTGFGGVTNMVDVGKVSGGFIGGLTIDNGGANTCINLRSNSAAVRLAPGYYNCSATPVADAGTGNITKLPVAEGGTGAATFTAHGVVLGANTAAMVATAAMTDGQVLVGQTGVDPLPKTLSGAGALSAAGALTVNLGAGATITGLLPFGNVGAVPAFSVTKGGTDQTGIVTATFTALTWPTVVYNVNGNFASNAWTPPAGKVSLFAAFNATGTITTGTQCAIAIYKNGSALRQNLNSAATNDAAASVYVEDAANGSDVYTVQALITTSAGTATVQGATNVTYFGGHWIGP